MVWRLPIAVWARGGTVLIVAVRLIGFSGALSTLVLTHHSRSVKCWEIMPYASGMGRNDFSLS